MDLCSWAVGASRGGLNISWFWVHVGECFTRPCSPSPPAPPHMGARILGAGQSATRPAPRMPRRGQQLADGVPTTRAVHPTARARGRAPSRRPAAAPQADGRRGPATPPAAGRRSRPRARPARPRRVVCVLSRRSHPLPPRPERHKHVPSATCSLPAAACCSRGKPRARPRRCRRAATVYPFQLAGLPLRAPAVRQRPHAR
jgi:hypothetical protein